MSEVVSVTLNADWFVGAEGTEIVTDVALCFRVGYVVQLRPDPLDEVERQAVTSQQYHQGADQGVELPLAVELQLISPALRSVLRLCTCGTLNR